MTEFTSTAAAKRAAGNVSCRNSKMPGSTFAADPMACPIGQKLATVPGSVCEGCYAIKLAKLRPSCAKGWSANQDKLEQIDRESFVAGAIFQITLLASKSGEHFHRWFDAGDLPNEEALDRIVEIARKTPDIAHWLPTRELKTVAAWRKAHGEFPSNLMVRLSSTRIGDAPRDRAAAANGMGTSTVHRKGEDHHGHACPAPSQGGNCGTCRACWSSSKNVSYLKH